MYQDADGLIVDFHQNDEVVIPADGSQTCCQRLLELHPRSSTQRIDRLCLFPISTEYNAIVFGMIGKVQQLTTATITITPNTTNRNVLDSVFIATAGLTPWRAIIKPKVSTADPEGTPAE